jgi:hypothetical protein
MADVTTIVYVHFLLIMPRKATYSSPSTTDMITVAVAASWLAAEHSIVALAQAEGRGIACAIAAARARATVRDSRTAARSRLATSTSDTRGWCRHRRGRAALHAPPSCFRPPLRTHRTPHRSQARCGGGKAAPPTARTVTPALAQCTV